MKKQKKLGIKVRNLKPVKDAKGGHRKHPHRRDTPKVNESTVDPTNPTGAGLWDWPA
jgi:hypothetical protein